MIGQFRGESGWWTTERRRLLKSEIATVNARLTQDGGAATGIFRKAGAFVVLVVPSSWILSVPHFLDGWARQNGCSFEFHELN